MLDTISAPLATKLHAPISWKSGDADIQSFLAHLQGNIVKGHGRNNVVYLFCRFRPGMAAQARAFLRTQAARVRSAKDQLECADRKRRTGVKDDRPLVCVFLSKAGYDYLGVPHARQPTDPAFQAGMGAAQLGDPPQAQWDSHLRAPHAMILIAVGSPEAAQTESTDLLNAIGQIGDVAAGQSGELIGNQFFNGDGNGVENFGYVDGRSQPLVLEEDIAAGGDQELPTVGFPVDQFVVPDLGAGDPTAYGSYFVFRQLEQDVRGFKHREDLLTAGRDSDFPNRDSAGVGRLESGTPFELTGDDGNHPNITNNFTFTSDPPRCPHFAHIRKVNPRTPQSRGMIMIRRGITYGTRADAHPDPADPTRMVLEESPAPNKIPSRGVGLLFQSYQADIARQFETTQLAANSPAGGVDPVIGQTRSALLDWPHDYGGAATDKVEFYSRDGKASPAGPYVKLLGGGYFFAPSLPFLHSL